MHARFRYLGLDIIVFRICTSSSLYEKIENRIRGNASQYAPVHLFSESYIRFSILLVTLFLAFQQPIDPTKVI